MVCNERMESNLNCIFGFSTISMHLPFARLNTIPSFIFDWWRQWIQFYHLVARIQSRACYNWWSILCRFLSIVDEIAWSISRRSGIIIAISSTYGNDKRLNECPQQHVAHPFQQIEQMHEWLRQESNGQINWRMDQIQNWMNEHTARNILAGLPSFLSWWHTAW